LRSSPPPKKKKKKNHKLCNIYKSPAPTCAFTLHLVTFLQNVVRSSALSTDWHVFKTDLRINFLEKVDGDFVRLLLRAADALEVQLVRLHLDLWVFYVFQANRQEDKARSLSPHHRWRRNTIKEQEKIG
jgi:hypothetical protein